MRLVKVRTRAAAALCSAFLLGAAGTPAMAQQNHDRGLRATVSLSRALLRQEPLVEIQSDYEGWGREVLRIGQKYELKQGETIQDVVSVFSPASIEGHVRGDVTVIFGTVAIGPNAVIDGSLVVVGGNVTIQNGAAVRTDLVVVGGGLDAPVSFAPGRQHVAIGATAIADRLSEALPWITGGLLLGRPLVPSLSWVWIVVLITFVVSLLCALLFANGVRTSAEAIAAKPFTTFLVGLIVLLLTGPVAVVLTVSVVGILVVPFALCALVIAWTIGKVGVAVRLGDIMTGQAPPASRLVTVRSLVLGFAAVMLIYMVPVVGFITWGLVGVTGLGAATLAFTSAYRRENPARPKPPKPIPTPPSSGAVEAGSDSESLSPDLPQASAFLNGGAASAVATAVPSATNLLGFPKASFLVRAAAFALDSLFIFIVSAAIGLMDDDETAGVVILAMLLYHVGFWAWKSTTFGGIVCQLRIIRLDGTAVRPVDAIVRGIASIFSLAVLGLGCLWIVRDEERQAWHDKIAGTYVVSVPRNWPLM
jgi:uncharacterized RDD family membrane protein YckC